VKIGFKAIEALRHNPKSFWSESTFRGGGRSKFVRWQDSIGCYHSHNDDLKKAETYLRKTMSNVKTLKDEELINYLGYLQQYHLDYSKLQSTNFQYRKNFNFPLKLDYEFGGQIPRVDLNIDKDGYSIYFFEKELYDWEDELRFPLLQNFMATYFDCKNKDVYVGAYFLKEGKHRAKSYSQKQVNDSVDELNKIVTEIEKHRKKK